MGWGIAAAGLASAYAGYKGASDANRANANLNKTNRAFNANMAESTRAYQSQMSNTAMQRGVADMKAAGINPILAAGGGGASTPPGATATAAGASNTVQDEISPAVQSALALTQQKKQIELVDAQTKKTRADTMSPEKVAEWLRSLDALIPGLKLSDKLNTSNILNTPQNPAASENSAADGSKKKRWHPNQVITKGQAKELYEHRHPRPWEHRNR